ncbi:hypothetical protein HC928_24740 [bacterium]|nr:hypothetical protein [bacterium]
MGIVRSTSSMMAAVRLLYSHTMPGFTPVAQITASDTVYGAPNSMM